MSKLSEKLTILALLLLLLAMASWAAMEWNAMTTPPPGRWFYTPTRLVAGEKTRLELHYRQGEKPLPPGTVYAFELEGLSVSSFNHAPISNGFKLIHGASPIEWTKGAVDGVDRRPVRLTFPKGLKPGEEFALRIGNPTPDGDLEAMINPVPVQSLRTDIRAEHSGANGIYKSVRGSWLKHGWWAALPTVDIMAGKPEYLRVFGPSLIQCGKPFDVRIGMVDAFDDPAYPDYLGKVEILNPDVAKGLPRWVKFSAEDQGAKRLEGVSLAKPGVYRLQLRLAGAKRVFESNPIVVREKVDEPIYWGQLHNHGWYSECWGQGTPFFYRMGRDFSGLDYLALSDHGLMPSKTGKAGVIYAARFGRPITSYDACMEKIATADKFNQPGRFVSLIGYEWSSEQSGHYIGYLPHMTQENYATMFCQKPIFTEYTHEMRAVMEKTEGLWIPHISTAYFPYGELVVGKTASGQPLTPVIEVYSDWGMSFHGPREPGSDLLGRTDPGTWGHGVREAISRGLMLGIEADSDSHTGLPGRRCSAGCSNGHRFVPGITAIRGGDLTRDGVFAAYRRRATYGTSGEHIFLEVKASQTPMGQVLRTDKMVPLDVEVAGTDVIRSVSVYGGTHLIGQKSLNGARDGQLRFDLPPPGKDLVPYFVEVIQENEHRAWASPIWVGRASMPDLAWEKDTAGRLWLLNKGAAAARQVRVLHDANETPFVNRCVIAPKPDCTNVQGGLVWTHIFSDNQLVVHFRWTGPPLSGKVSIIGQCSYWADESLRMDWFETLKDLGNGQVAFDGRKGRVDRTKARPGPPKSEGFDLTVTAKPDENCKVVYDFDREIPVYVGEELRHVRHLEIPVNQYHPDLHHDWLTVAEIPAGGRWPAPSAQGCWSANPEGIGDELERDNNFFEN